ncbi:FMN reductase (NADPH) [Brevibacillus fluminis]|uniref:FMN reductase (NADPH) n=1 Tax=Brevibacillus fluminis TaxID=511487 RepID=A0A3M8DHJ9_9BACL|nr:NADPH-dependent FMN reductase [Brevibacillus fluminis]RNB87079.1 FMN reductase (NADPH) [Brevibacillus fluminis]
MPKTVIISGSPSAKSRVHGVLQLAAESLQNEGHTVEWVNVWEIPADDLLSLKFDSPALTKAFGLVEAADAVIVATPVYKASYSGILKVFLDLLPQKALENKTVFPIAVGGTLAHLLIIDYALKPVLAALGAEHIVSGVYVLDSHVAWGSDGRAALAGEVRERLDAGLQKLAHATAVASIR